MIATVAAQPEFAQHFGDATGIWNFASPEETEAKLAAAGFDAGALLAGAEAGSAAEYPLEFTSTVTLGPLLAQLPEEKRRPFAEAILEHSANPLVLDYVRLNIEARAGA